MHKSVRRGTVAVNLLSSFSVLRPAEPSSVALAATSCGIWSGRREAARFADSSTNTDLKGGIAKSHS